MILFAAILMRKHYLLLFNLLSLINYQVAFATDLPQWNPDYAAETVEEPEWIIFGVIVVAVIVIGRGVYYIHKNAKK
jgi:uncharacterized membrane protein